jgi:hypothetical protein
VLQDTRTGLEGTLRERLSAGAMEDHMEEHMEDHILHTTGFLGLDEDLSTSWLLQKAASHGMAPDSAGLAAAYKQALADTETFKTVLKQVRLWPRSCPQQLCSLGNWHCSQSILWELRASSWRLWSC